MEENNVTVVIRSLQRLEGESESMTQCVEGSLSREGTDYVLTYREGEASGLGQTRTTLRLEPGRVTLTRWGEFPSHMVFQKGEPHTSLYETPYGKLPMTLHTQHLEGDMSQTGGSIYLIYRIQLGGADAGETRLRLTVNTKENRHD